jgi:hypothetical protein
MKCNILLLGSVLLLLSCHQKTENNYSIRTGSVEYTYEGTTHTFKGQFNQNNLPHGHGEIYTKDGIRIAEGDFFNGILNGWFTVFYEDGSKTSTQYFHGQKGDLTIDYYPEGKIKSMIIIHNGEYQYQRNYSIKGKVDTTFYKLNVVSGSDKDHTFLIRYKFVDPFFKGGWVDLFFNDTFGKPICKERIHIYSQDSTIFPKPIQRGEYLVEFEFYSMERNELINRVKLPYKVLI